MRLRSAVVATTPQHDVINANLIYLFYAATMSGIVQPRIMIIGTNAISIPRKQFRNDCYVCRFCFSFFVRLSPLLESTRRLLVFLSRGNKRVIPNVRGVTCKRASNFARGDYRANRRASGRSLETRKRPLERKIKRHRGDNAIDSRTMV